MRLRKKSNDSIRCPSNCAAFAQCIAVMLTLVFGVCNVKAEAEEEFQSVYVWKPGAWGRCMGQKCGLGGIQTRSVWCAHVEGWTTLPTNCKPVERPVNQQNCFKVCDRHKDLYEWRVGEWNECSPVSTRGPSSKQTSECLEGEDGIQRRNVTCIEKRNGAASEDVICEYFESKPHVEQACLIPCPQNCVVAEFTPWSECTKSCGVGLQHRLRQILLPPLNGGEPCPKLTEFQTCTFNSCLAEESVHSLKVGPWSECSLPHSRQIRQAGSRTRDPEAWELMKKKRNRNRQIRQDTKYFDIQIGYQTRQVTCTHKSGKTAALSLCTQLKLPITFQSCVVPKDCQTSEWSEWSPCSKTCYSATSPKGFRARTSSINQFPVGGGKECPSLEEQEPCSPEGEGVPPCATYLWRTTEWSECRVDSLLNQQDRRRGNQTALCGGGIQTREFYCVQANENLLSYLNTLKEKEASKPVDNKMCTGPTPSTTQMCQIICPIECEVSPWTAWGPCTYESCQDPQGKKGFKLRKRQITNEPTGGIGNCPHLHEAILCDDPSCYSWQIVKLGECLPDNGSECGPGIQTPEVQCVNSIKVVDRNLCNEAIYPVPVSCEVPCPKDCVLSKWSGWSSCSYTCSGKTTEGKQMRARSILAYAEEGAAQCPNISALQEVRSCNEHPCVIHHWQTGPWGLCIEDLSVAGLNSSTSWSGEATCAVGMQTRKVICVRVNVGQVGPKKCPESLRPDTVRPCLLPCRKDCIVTSYSDWTPCPLSCKDGDDSTAKQSRHRIIIQLPSNGGHDCPDTLVEDKDCESPRVCNNYRWKTHKWRRCQLVPWYIRQDSPGAHETCGPGLQTRALSCRKQDGGQVDMSYCLKWAGTMPFLTQHCQLPCQDDCQFTNWSKFSSCTGDCGTVQTRRRTIVGKSKKREKCRNTQLFPLIETQFCPCDKYTAQPLGNWSDCILPEGKMDTMLGMKVQGDIKECGRGYRYQALACRDQNNRLVESARCNRHAYIEEACVIPCPSDCKLSEWSNWSRCSKSCGSGVKVRSKWLREKPYNGGRPCPKLDHVDQAQVYEVVPCHSDCSQYVWIAEPWSVCKVSTVDLKDNCGEGVQTRKVRCMQNTVDGPIEFVEDYLCDPEEMPLGSRQCKLPCPDDCVMSEWTTWSKCPLPCNSSATRERSALPLRQPGEGKPCPAETKTEPCHLNKNCFHYTYNVTDWSTCQLSEKAVCGNGIKTRMLDCVRSDGKSVDLKYCEEMGAEKPWQMNASCTVECPVNCLFSDWSPWSDCSQSCGLGGEMLRKRTLIQPFQGDGRPCIMQLEQSKPCLIRPCYRWQYSEWGHCKVEDAQCGNGMKFRNMSCVVFDGSREDSGKVVDDEFCADLEPAVNGDKQIVLQASCAVPCPGDCYLTDWSVWSSCQLTCVNNQDLGYGGVQVRTKAVIVQAMENEHLCPVQTLETRTCTGGHCYEYIWLAGAWTGTYREVWCQRSDGINVTGGCSALNQPYADRSCNPPCTKPHAYCTESAVCVCEEGYTEVVTSGNLLDQCIMIPVLEIPSVEEKKADVKTSRAVNPTQTSDSKQGHSGHTWFLQPFGADGKLKTWVYGVAAGGFVLIIFIVSMIYLACKKPKKPQRKQNNKLKPLTLAYDGDADM
ncbi:thrombospondin type-1 domain-containing protein 7A isoform X1 [Amblyraja radiata]|uniref:thrombospondin type-1 domain-containing protein 7A isoform X1 n=1 Tax=Amblyraja radiata TaxID=386614 RepID=UPI00140327E1|nr:thrombospondin type-1 domain-containing protein 7A isoform X1 [Amblyraja radiata]